MKRVSHRGTRGHPPPAAFRARPPRRRLPFCIPRPPLRRRAHQRTHASTAKGVAVAVTVAVAAVVAVAVGQWQQRRRQRWLRVRPHPALPLPPSALPATPHVGARRVVEMAAATGHHPHATSKGGMAARPCRNVPAGGTAAARGGGHPPPPSRDPQRGVGGGIEEADDKVSIGGGANVPLFLPFFSSQPSPLSPSRREPPPLATLETQLR